jgi:hypothetical protein
MGEYPVIVHGQINIHIKIKPPCLVQHSHPATPVMALVALAP